jgi:hypothetical protein
MSTSLEDSARLAVIDSNVNDIKESVEDVRDTLTRLASQREQQQRYKIELDLEKYYSNLLRSPVDFSFPIVHRLDLFDNDLFPLDSDGNVDLSFECTVRNAKAFGAPHFYYPKTDGGTEAYVYQTASRGGVSTHIQSVLRNDIDGLTFPMYGFSDHSVSTISDSQTINVRPSDYLYMKIDGYKGNPREIRCNNFHLVLTYDSQRFTLPNFTIKTSAGWKMYQVTELGMNLLKSVSKIQSETEL